MSYDSLLKKAFKIDETNTRDNVLLTDAKIITLLLDECQIEIPSDAVFFVRTDVAWESDRLMRHILFGRQRRLEDRTRTQQDRIAKESYAYSGNFDYGHTAPGWENIFRLGLEGLRQRILNRKGPAENPDFVPALVMVLEAAQRFCIRAAACAEACGKNQMAEGLRNLAYNPPRDLYEGFQLTLLYYNLQHGFERTNVRTMGRLDQLLQPFYCEETDKVYAQTLADQYMVEINSYKASEGANMPFALGGSDAMGNCMICDMSYVLLKAYAKSRLPEVKLHILCTKDMPRDFLTICMESIKAGGNSLVFVNDKLVADGLYKLGQRREDAAGYDIIGCYEAGGKEEVPCSCTGQINIPKALEYALHQGVDMLSGQQVGLDIPPEFDTFDDLLAAFYKNLEMFASKTMEIINRFESFYPQVHGAPFYSASLDTCVERGADVYCDFGARYNNSSINVMGIGTATDSLYTIRKLVYEEKRLSLAEFIRILDENWENHEVLRLSIRNKLPKYGNGIAEVDEIARDIARYLSDRINGKPNGRSGVYRMGIYSINRRKTWGDHTGATPDGRRNCETLSQNASATFGMDKAGMTGHVRSVATLPGVDAVNGSILDLEMHASSVKGDSGTKALVASLETFIREGGQSVHYNVLDTETLKDAQIHPEEHSNLQVRMCGWNELFVNMSKENQDEFIERSQMHLG